MNKQVTSYPNGLSIKVAKRNKKGIGNYNYFLLYLCILSNFHLLNLIYTFDYINFFVFNFISELLDILVLVSYLSAHNNPFTLMYPFNLDLIQI
jgi:hypothetical protein